MVEYDNKCQHQEINHDCDSDLRHDLGSDPDLRRDLGNYPDIRRDLGDDPDAAI